MFEYKTIDSHNMTTSGTRISKQKILLAIWQQIVENVQRSTKTIVVVERKIRNLSLICKIFYHVLNIVCLKMPRLQRRFLKKSNKETKQ